MGSSGADGAGASGSGDDSGESAEGCGADGAGASGSGDDSGESAEGCGAVASGAKPADDESSMLEESGAMGFRRGGSPKSISVTGYPRCECYLPQVQAAKDFADMWLREQA